MKAKSTVFAFTTFLVTSTVSVALAEEPKPGDRVLAMRAGTNSFFAAKVVTASYEGGSVTFDDGTTQEYGPITFEPSLRPYTWKVGGQIECGPDVKAVVDVGDAESDKLTKGNITAFDGTKVEVTKDGKKATFELAACRHHRTWWDELSEHWRNYGGYATIKAMPKAGAKSPSPDEVSSSFSYALESMDGGSYIQIKKCVTTGKSWVKLNSGDELTARSVEVACAIAIPLPPKPQEMFACVVEYGFCRQPYQGAGEYGGCEWHYSKRTADQIKCASIK
jgi:hypothetical protein